jgi:hypothetical protein
MPRKKEARRSKKYWEVFRGDIALTEDHILMSDTLEPFYLMEGVTAYMDDTLYLDGIAAVEV